MPSAYPKKKGETVYYVRLYGYSFPVIALDNKGKPIQKTNPATGMPIYFPNGDPEYVEKIYEFKKWKTKFCADGYVSVFVVDKDTDPRVVATLEACAKDRGNEIMSEKAFIQTVNPELAEQLDRDEKMQSVLSEKDSQISVLAKEVEEMKKKLSGVK